MIDKIVVPQLLDKTSKLEVFTSEVLQLNGLKIDYLHKNGLPKIGTFITNGMILVGKLGNSKENPFHENHDYLDIVISNELLDEGYDIDSPDFDEVFVNKRIEKLSTVLEDRSYYFSSTFNGIVKNAFFEESSGNLRAIIELEIQ